MSPAKDRFKPVRPDNLPAARRDPDDDEPTIATAAADPPSAPAVSPPPTVEPATASEDASLQASNVASMQAEKQAEPRVAGRRTGRRLNMRDIMHGRVDPEKDYAQSGVRLKRYVLDGVRTVVATSRGDWSAQEFVNEAVKAFMPPEILVESWELHGGTGLPPGIDDIEEEQR